MVRPFSHTQNQQNTRTRAVPCCMRRGGAHTVRYRPGGPVTSKGGKLTSFFKTG